MVVNFGWQPFVQQAISYTQSLVPVAETYVTAVQNITADALQDNSPLNPSKPPPFKFITFLLNIDHSYRLIWNCSTRYSVRYIRRS